MRVVGVTSEQEIEGHSREKKNRKKRMRRNGERDAWRGMHLREKICCVRLRHAMSELKGGVWKSPKGVRRKESKRGPQRRRDSSIMGGIQ